MSDKKTPYNSDDLNEILEDIVTSDKVAGSHTLASEEVDAERAITGTNTIDSEERMVEKKRRRPLHSLIGSFLYGIWRVTRIFVLIGIVIGSLFAAAYVLQQDELVRNKFEGKRWSLPARVFARPLELYEGQSIVPNDLHKELQLLNYAFVTHLFGTGQYKRSKNTFYIQTRGFQFAEDQEISRRIRVVIRNNRISSLSNTESSERLTLMRLEPVLIGNFYPHHNEDRVLVRLDDVTPLLAKGLIAVEDKKYYEHFGINLKSIVRALLANAKAGRKVQGASTLTQQLVKNFFLSSEKSYKRKATEAVMSILLELHYSKDEILEAYLNEIYLGQNGKRSINGFGLGSQFYFNKPMSELTVEQVALLIGIAKGPSVYNPRTRPEAALERRNLVLDVMAREGVIDPNLLASIKSQSLGVTKSPPPSVSPFPAYLELVRRQLQRDYQEEDLRSEGLLIFTSMDPVLQITAEKVLQRRVRKLERSKRIRKGKLNSAMVVSSVQGAEILAVVGGRDARFAGYNRAINASRQVGSLIKPAVYLAALESKKFNLGTALDGGPVTVRLSRKEIWKPKNYSGRDLGMVTFQNALLKSMNTPTVRIGITLGLDNVIDELHSLGLHREITPNPSLLLGAIQMTPMEVQQIYQTIAAGGTYTPLTAIRSVMDSYGNALRRYPLQVKQVASEKNVYLLTYVMNKITKEGTAKYLSKVLPAWKNSAGKTGTTNRNVDSWFAGFTGKHVVSVWVGRDDNKPTGLTGGDGALKVWADFIKVIQTKPFKPKRPSGIRFYTVNKNSGMLNNPACGASVVLPFAAGTQPRKVHRCAEVYYEVNKENASRQPSWESRKSSKKKLDQTVKNSQGIWNKDKQIKHRPTKQQDPSLWIDNLMRR